MKKHAPPQHCFPLLSIFFAIIPFSSSFDYHQALSNSLLYFETQRSGRLPHNQRVTWRDHSGLTDGLEQGVSPFLHIFHIFIRINWLFF